MSNEHSSNFQIIIVSGRSGAGKSTVLKVFEDLRFFTIDGLPVHLAVDMVRVLDAESLSSYRGIVLGMDLRQSDFVHDFATAMNALNSFGVTPTILFIEAETSVLMQRYATTRRPHPLENEGMGLEQALCEEARRLEDVRRAADLVIDTTTYSIHELRRDIQRRWNSLEGRIRALKVNVISFGFKYGVPKEADIVFDLRFLPNPFLDDALRPFSGQEARVAEYVFQTEAASTFRDRFIEFIQYVLPLYEAEGRYRLTIATGCTGGRHRSVATAEALVNALRKADYCVTIEHRHLELG